MAEQSIGIIGGGAWGTALAETLCRAGRDVRLWARNAAVVDEINRQRTNATYLPGVKLNDALVATMALDEVARRDIVLMVGPAQQTRALATGMAPLVRPGTPIVLCSKGLEQATGKSLSVVVSEVLPHAIPAVLSGPSFAHDVVRGLPAALTIATADEAIGERLAAAIGYRNFRLYWSSDIIGTERGGSLKNVLAIAAGIADGKGLGASAHAALVTRGFAELRRFGVAFGARPETLSGLSGLGDLLLTCGSPQSRNMSLGRALGQGRALADILAERNSVSEGIYTAQAVASVAKARGIDMPISLMVAAIVAGKLPVDDAIDALLARPFKAED